MPHLSTHATLYSALRLVVPLRIKMLVTPISLSFPFYNTDESWNINKMIGLIRSTAICISRCGKHGDQAAMRAEPFHYNMGAWSLSNQLFASLTAYLACILGGSYQHCYIHVAEWWVAIFYSIKKISLHHICTQWCLSQGSGH